MRRLVVALVLLLALLSNVGGSHAVGQAPIQRFITLVLEPDLATLQVQVYGKIEPAPEAQDISGWGLAGLEFTRLADRWDLEGSLPSITVQKTDSGFYLLRLQGIVLDPSEELDLYAPFASIDWAGITPVPYNLSAGTELTSTPQAAKFRASTGGPLDIAIPFEAVQQQISLAITPVLGSLISHEDPGIRLSGEATLNQIPDYGDFERYCTARPSLDYNHSTGFLLYHLDYPTDAAYFAPPPNFELKSTSLRAVTQAVSCEFGDEKQSVTVNFIGRVFYNPRGSSPKQDVTEKNELLPNSGMYELRLGEVVLGPGDTLTLTMPGANLLNIRPAPTTLVEDAGDIHKAVYNGPQRFALVIRYSPQPVLLLRQIPSLGRSLALATERGLAPGRALGGLLWPDGALILGALAIGMLLLWPPLRRRLSRRVYAWLAAAALVLAGTGLFFLLPTAYGWLVLATGLLVLAGWPNPRWILAGGLLIIATLAASFLNPLTQRAFSMLGLLDNELTPLTPTLLLILAAGPAWLLLADPQKHKWLEWTPGLVAPWILFFLALSTCDAYQKSLPALIATVLWGLALGSRFMTGDSEAGLALCEAPGLIRRVFADRWFQLAFLILIIYVGIQGLGDTISVVAVTPTLGPLGLLLPPLLQLLSVVLAMAANALLFLLIYPLLPFKQGVLKAIVLAVLLLSLFMLGTAGDQRLILTVDQLAIGRFIYYLSAPLLVGMVVDLRISRQAVAGGETGEAAAPTAETTIAGARGLWSKVEKYGGLAGGILSLLAPTLYASLQNLPILTNYFQLLKLLSTLG